MKNVMDTFWQEPTNHFQIVLKGYEIELVKGTCTPYMYQHILFKVLSEWLSLKMDACVVVTSGNVRAGDTDYSSRVFDSHFGKIYSDEVQGL